MDTLRNISMCIHINVKHIEKSPRSFTQMKSVVKFWVVKWKFWLYYYYKIAYKNVSIDPLYI